ncbi:MAG: folate-binding protein YgfZ [Rickettsia endosymbiont of Ixodes persulcatus]|nr:folate-binding protein YgfZ [Rickettsia endosymbiont of Ixodes persulcatus]MCZ6902963.1 folate-binding protein YgfZ [Rickettsia endosymbiont of Ixodes persulcatus]MCZ6909502.1 folate-binding protein YgfZ [Rickettsia endosymbiont of Ixodes persulcatus]MCZ6909725.1 folate-binding protein YgfZ [Rickettsia endosymbiont of Ixodes persulcatus]MCZ6914666.1 folate-binding protein YgfZ [Rickettsia endosymbiont of Ixodes persulcatus]
MYEILSDREVIKIIGLDSVKFLQNLVTNDINKSQYCYTYLLNNQGRYLFDFFVYIHNFEEIYLDIDKSNKAVLIDHLNFYKFRSKIQIIDCSDEYKVIYSHQKLNIETLVTSRDPRYTKLGFRSIVNGTLKDTLDPLCYSREGGNPIYLEDKYNFAIIDGVEDLSFGKSIPILYGGEELNGISYDKGCYVGQEVISRAKYQWVIRRKIYKVIADEALSSLVKDEEILAYNDKIGVICSSYRNKAIALIREEKHLAVKESGINVKGISIELLLAPWY